MTQVLQLWNAIDTAVDPKSFSDAVAVLSDYFEEMGQDQQANCLRGDRSSRDWIFCSGLHDLPALIRNLDLRSARLFACACAEQMLDESLTEGFSALRTTRRHLFGQATDRELHAVQDQCYQRWLEAKSSLLMRSNVNEFWSLVRATGAVNRLRVSSVSGDALFAAIKSRNDGKGNNGWTLQQQCWAATEYLLLGRLIQESPDVIELRKHV